MTERFPHQRNRRSTGTEPSPADPASSGATGLTAASAHHRPAPQRAGKPAEDLAPHGYADADAEMPVFDEAFIDAAPVREASAGIRVLEARRRLSAADAQRWRAMQPTTTSWQIRPSHRLRSIRPSAVGAVAGIAALGVLLFAFLLR